MTTEEQTISLPTEDAIRDGEDACECEDYQDILHTAGDHAALAALPSLDIERYCSVCDLDWGEGAVSQHEGCAWLRSDGYRTYAHCITRIGGSVVEWRDD